MRDLSRSALRRCLRKLRFISIAVLASLLLQNPPALAHGPTADAIAELSHRLEHDPDNPDLWVARGELYGAEGRWDEAAQDFDSLARLSPHDPRLALHRGHMALENRRFLEAERELTRHLESGSGELLGYWLRGRARMQNGRACAAAVDFDEVVARQSPIGPEPFLTRARAQRRCDTFDPLSIVRGLEEGLMLLGPVPGLVFLAIEVDLDLGNTELALERLDRIGFGVRGAEFRAEHRRRILDGAKGLQP